MLVLMEAPLPRNAGLDNMGTFFHADLYVYETMDHNNAAEGIYHFFEAARAPRCR